MRIAPSPTLRSMVVYGIAGLAFAGANLVLARVLPAEQFAIVTLAVALITLAYHLAPVGFDALVIRGRVAATPPVLRLVALTAVLAGASMGGIAYLAYRLSGPTTGLVLAATVAGGLMLVAAARFQSEQRFTLSLAFTLSPNLLLLLGAIAVAAARAQTAVLPLTVLAVGLAVSAATAWWLVLRQPRVAEPSAARMPWSEAFALAGVAAAGMLLIQLERLVLPYLLPLADLALFGVLGAIVGSLFRLLQMGVGFTLLPRLRAAATVFERRHLIAVELRLAAGIAVAGAAAILVVMPFVERWLLAGKYHLPLALVIAAIASGIAKIAHAFAKATATALGTAREIALVNGAGWICAVLAAGAAILGARFGLTGLVYGVGVGWLAWAVLSFGIVAHHLRLPASVPAET